MGARGCSAVRAVNSAVLARSGGTAVGVTGAGSSAVAHRLIFAVDFFGGSWCAVSILLGRWLGLLYLSGCEDRYLTTCSSRAFLSCFSPEFWRAVDLDVDARDSGEVAGNMLIHRVRADNQARQIICIKPWGEQGLNIFKSSHIYMRIVNYTNICHSPSLSPTSLL